MMRVIGTGILKANGQTWCRTYAWLQGQTTCLSSEEWKDGCRWVEIDMIMPMGTDGTLPIYRKKTFTAKIKKMNPSEAVRFQQEKYWSSIGNFSWSNRFEIWRTRIRKNSTFFLILIGRLAKQEIKLLPPTLYGKPMGQVLLERSLRAPAINTWTMSYRKSAPSLEHYIRLLCWKCFHLQSLKLFLINQLGNFKKLEIDTIWRNCYIVPRNHDRLAG